MVNVLLKKQLFEIFRSYFYDAKKNRPRSRASTIIFFFLYTVLRNVSFTFYPVRLLVCVLAFAVSSFGCTLVLETHLMRTPMEGCIQLLAERMGTTMGRLRQKIDVALVLLSVAITLIFGVEWTLREGTVIAALIFGPMMDFWKKTVFSGRASR